MINGGVTASGGRNAQPYVSPTRMDDCNFEERRTFRCVLLPQDHAVVLNPGDKLGAEKKKRMAPKMGEGSHTTGKTEYSRKQSTAVSSIDKTKHDKPSHCVFKATPTTPEQTYMCR